MTTVKKKLPKKTVKKKTANPSAKKAKVAKASAKKAKVAKPSAKKAKVVKASAKKAKVAKPSAKKAKVAKPLVKAPAMVDSKKLAAADFAIEQTLKALFDLQGVDSQIDKIRTVRGELPLEVQDLEDEIAGLETRVNNHSDEVKKLDDLIKAKKNEIKDAQAVIKKYEKQQDNVRNNREYDSLSKEIEFQNLEIQLSDKKIKEHKAAIELKNETIAQAEGNLKEKKDDLKHKNKELDEIVAETEKEEQNLVKKSVAAEKIIEERVLSGYKRIRKNARNGLAVVTVERNACGGCFNNVPPQRQLDIRLHKKIIVCEHCGRILVDPEINSIKLN